VPHFTRYRVRGLGFEVQEEQALGEQGQGSGGETSQGQV